ncbi:MAG: type II toxin-antitoxin system prevent-host-death family antitoxin [Coriobacteriia bacterium]|nr:type II toxin-antitoxin system prevent-host-death family antitoxin [Coriobacteriia bacterium]
MTRMSVAEARKDLAEVINRAAYARERTVITRHETDVAAVISIDELRLLDALIEKYEDEIDIAEAREALLEVHEENVAWTAIKREFGL